MEFKVMHSVFQASLGLGEKGGGGRGGEKKGSKEGIKKERGRD